MTTTTTTTTWRDTTSPHTQPIDRPSPVRRFFCVVKQPQSYRNLGYLLLGLPLGTIWFTILVSAYATAISMLVVALLGIPMLWGLWYVTRSFANTERATANALLAQHLPLAPLTSADRGNVWVRLRSMGRDRDRWRELAYLLLRFPVGIATFTVAVTALATPFMIAWAPFNVRLGNNHPFGDWALSSRMEDVASSSWSWFLVPLGFAMLICSFHLMNVLAKACGRWATRWLGSVAR